MNYKIIGLSGTNGSGKDTVMHLLADKHGYLFMSATDMLRDELERRGKPTDRKHKSALSAEWRREFGMDVIVQKAYEEYAKKKSAYKGLVVGSLRHPGEADLIHKYGGIMMWVDADPRVRYDRIQANAHHRGRKHEDEVTFEHFMADEEREMHPEGDEATLHGAAVKERCDVFLENDGDDIAAFQKVIENALKLS